MKKIIKVVMCFLCVFLIGCGTVEDGDKETIKEINDVVETWLETTKNGDYEGMQNQIGGALQEQFAPVVLYTNLTSQCPESQSCQKNSLELAKYVLTRLYQDAKIEKTSVSQDKSEARVLMSWKSIDTDKVNTENIKDTINNIIEEQYQLKKDEYDLNTEQFGDESTKMLLQDDAFDKVFEQIRKLYEEAPDKNMRGVLCYSYKTNEGYKLTGITQYMDLLYHEDGTYNWDYESAQTTFEKDKNMLENQGATE